MRVLLVDEWNSLVEFKEIEGLVKVLKRHWVIVGLVVVAIGILAAFKLKGSEKTEYYTTAADHGDIHQMVEATGTINAVTTVQVGSQVSGTICSTVCRLQLARQEGTGGGAD